MNLTIIASFFILATVSSECNLSILYKERATQSTVRQRLNNFFERKFTDVKQEAKDKAKYLIPPSAHFKKDIKKLFIEYGVELKNIEDLDLILKSLNYTRIAIFKEYKDHPDKFGDEFNYEEWIRNR